MRHDGTNEVVSRLRILQIGTHYPFHIYGDEVFGGVENNLKQCVDVLSSQYQLQAIGYNTRNETRRYERDGVPVIACASLGKFSSQWVSPRFIWEIARAKPDIIHLHAPEVLGMFAVLFFHRRTPLVITHHLDIVRQRFLRLFVRPFYRVVLKRAKVVIVYTKKYAEMSEELIAVSDQVAVVPHGTREDELILLPGEQEAALEEKKELFGSSNVVAFLGRHVGYKGIDYLIEAMVELPEIQLMIGGGGEKTAEWQALSKARGLEARVHFIGNIKTAEARRKFYAMSDLFVLPSLTRSESFGQVLVEAQLSSVPVLTTETGSGNTEIVQDGKTGYVVPPADAFALAKSIKMAFSDDAKRNEMRDNALANAKARYTDRQCGVALLEVFGKVAASTG
tara:strand:- start:365 stop:1546 length:1182 start_codon:yes stop_codon:yes gene_type:complete